jgi:hypothetical protein
MKAMGKATLTLGLMLIVSLLMTSCSGVVTPELDPEEINKVNISGWISPRHKLPVK